MSAESRSAPDREIWPLWWNVHIRISEEYSNKRIPDYTVCTKATNCSRYHVFHWLCCTLTSSWGAQGGIHPNFEMKTNWVPAVHWDGSLGKLWFLVITGTLQLNCFAETMTRGVDTNLNITMQIIFFFFYLSFTFWSNVEIQQNIKYKVSRTKELTLFSFDLKVWR